MESLIQGGDDAAVQPAEPAGQPTPPADQPKPLLEEIDKRFHVLGQDGSPDIEAMLRKTAKSYREAEKLVQARKNRAPEAYDRTAIVPDGLEIGDDVLDIFKKLDISQDQAKGVLALLPKVHEHVAEQAASLQRERLALKWGFDNVETPEFKTRFNTVAKWAVDTFGRDAAANIATTAEGFLGLEMQMKIMQGQQKVTAPGKSSGAVDAESARKRLIEIAGSKGYRDGTDKALIAEAAALSASLQRGA